MAKQTELLAAVRRGDADAVASILKTAREAASAKDESGLSALILAAYRGRRDIAEMLANGRNDLTIFEATVMNDHIRIAALIEAIPEAVGAVSSDGYTPLGLAAFFGNLEAVTVLLARGAVPNVASKNPLKVAPLHSALAGGQRAIALLLLDAGADPNLANAEGWTPLHYAADIGDAEIASLLMDLGADTSKVDSEGRTAAQLAADVGHEHVADVIFQAVGVE